MFVVHLHWMTVFGLKKLAARLPRPKLGRFVLMPHAEMQALWFLLRSVIVICLEPRIAHLNPRGRRLCETTSSKETKDIGKDWILLCKNTQNGKSFTIASQSASLENA